MENVQNGVSVIGLGVMGTALARTLLRAGHRVTVWNRTAERARSLVEDGAILATSAAAAVGASPIVVVCVASYEATRGMLGTDEAAGALRGRTLVQLSTGSPREARDLEAWARERGVAYLDGAIMAIPDQIGTPEAAILASGAESAFHRAKPFLEAMAGHVYYAGEPVGSAAALDFAVLSHLFGGLLGAIHGALVCESEGLRVDAYGSMVADLAPVIGSMVKHGCDAIQAGAYDNPQSTVSTCARGMEGLLRQARDAEIDSAFPAFAAGVFRRAEAAGYGEEEFAAVAKVLRAVRTAG